MKEHDEEEEEVKIDHTWINSKKKEQK